MDLGRITPEWKDRTNKVDITFDDSIDGGQHSIHYGVLFTEWVHNKRTELPYFFPLVILLKKLLSLTGLNIPYYG